MGTIERSNSVEMMGKDVELVGEYSAEVLRVIEDIRAILEMQYGIDWDNEKFEFVGVEVEGDFENYGFIYDGLERSMQRVVEENENVRKVRFAGVESVVYK